MDPYQLLRVARTLVFEGGATRDGQPSRDAILDASGVRSNNTFRSAAARIGGHKKNTGLRFFDATRDGELAFGPGAGVCVGASVGARTVRAVLVDANGWQYAQTELKAMEGQLDRPPAVVMERVGSAIRDALRTGVAEHPELLSDGRLPLLGCSVAWPTPISRGNYQVGHGLADPTWGNEALDRRVRAALDVSSLPVFVMSDAHAAAIAVARRETRGADARGWEHARLTMVLRLAGNVSGAVVVIEKPRDLRSLGIVSGFERSILLGGYDNLAGEIAHVPLPAGTIASLQSNGEGLRPLAPHRCSCMVDDSQEQEQHLEAYASVLSLTKRLYPARKRGAALQAILKNPATPRHTRALGDIGTIVGDTMAAPVMMLNPGTIFLTGSLALAPLERSMGEHLRAVYRVGGAPTIVSLQGEENENVRALGAALALIRVRVYRRLEELLVGRATEEKIAGLTRGVEPSSL